MEADRREFYQASMKYVLKLQEMHEKKKFEFVENVSDLCLNSCHKLFIGCVQYIIE